MTTSMTNPCSTRKRLLPWVIPVVFGTVAGCPRNEPDLGPFAEVRGTVRLDGEPVSEGIVTFHCPDSGQVATAEIQRTGGYEMKLGKRSGLPLGHYTVCIQPAFRPPTEEAPRRRGRLGLDSETLTATTTIPAIYHYASSSGLSVDVARGVNTLDFDLEREAP